jgi:two-component system chemotaxis sensor kinase CheA
MLPFAQSCAGLDRMVRDLGLSMDKEVDLAIAGGDVEIDRSILEGLRDPLRHMVRNAVDHGIEPPHERRHAGKPARGRVTASAQLRGERVEVTVSDDGRGLVVAAIKRQARQRNVPLPPDDRDIAQVLFTPGFSTAQGESATMVSGRGIGLDVVKTQVEALHGKIDVSFVAGHGTRFVLTLPLTLTLIRVLMVSAGGHVFAVNGANVHKLLRVDPAELHPVGGRATLTLDGKVIPAASLRETLGLPRLERRQEGARRPVMVLAAEERRVAFLVDELLAEQEVMVQGLGARVRHARNLAGATILPDGAVALVLNAADLVQGVIAGGASESLLATVARAGEHKRQRRLLVVDDSVTTRSLEKSILEASGFLVSIASDGRQAWEMLQADGADLVLTDAEMPRMDGFQLTAAIRSSERFRSLPVILVTGLETAESKERGMKAGASAYVVKGEFDQPTLLRLVDELL